MNEILFSSQSNEWFTPYEYLILIRQLLNGVIELDPASCLEANQTVKAQRIYTISDNGLNQDWCAKNVFLNPPYGRTENISNAGIWAAKMIDEYSKRHFEQGVLLVNASTSEKWFRQLFNFPICFTYRRIKFVPPARNSSKPKAPTKGNAFIYFGKEKQIFADIFNQIGCVMKKY